MKRTTIEQLLSLKAMLAVAQAKKGGVPADIIPPEFLAVRRQVIGDEVSYYKVEGSRKLARRVQRGNPAVIRNIPGVSKESATLCHMFEEIKHDPSILEKLTNYSSPAVQDMGRAEVDRKTVEFKGYFSNLRLAMAYSVILNQGKIWFDGDGNFLPSASGAVLTIDFGVPAANVGNLTGTATVLLEGSAAKWSDAATPILSQLADLIVHGIKANGYRITHAFYGRNVPEYISANTTVGKIIEGNNAYQQEFLNNRIPNGFGEIARWIPVQTAIFEDASGTIQEMSDPDTIIFTPSPAPDWWEPTEGSNLIPKSLSIQMDATQMMSNLQQVYGFASYCTLETNPAGINQFCVDTYLPILKVPGCVYSAKVHW